MNPRYSAFDALVMFGLMLVITATGITILLSDSQVFETLIFLGIWVVFCFFILVFLHGSIQGVPRRKIQIPRKMAVLAFSACTALFVSAWLLSPI